MPDFAKLFAAGEAFSRQQNGSPIALAAFDPKNVTSPTENRP